jgi:hypothetical protein
MRSISYFALILFVGTAPLALGADAGLVASYSFEGDAMDLSGSHDGTISGATFTKDRLGNPGGALLFDGVDDFVRIAHDAALDYDQLTLVALVKVTGLPKEHRWNAVLAKSSELSLRPYGNFRLSVGGRCSAESADGERLSRLRDPGGHVGRAVKVSGAPRLDDSQTLLDCEKVADADDNGKLDINDPVYLLGFLPLRGDAPKEPFPAPGVDTTPDDLDCCR